MRGHLNTANQPLYKKIFSLNMLTMLLQGFSSGLPLLLTGSVLQAWLTESDVDLTSIGLFGLVGLPYAWKFLWSPLLDRFKIPFLSRRRGWIFVFQLTLMACLFLLGSLNPKIMSLWYIAAAALLVSFFSASQDIVIDAYRREVLSEEELGLGSSLYVNGYRLALLVANAFPLYLASFIPWQYVYYVMAVMMGLCALPTLFAPMEDEKEGTPKTIKEAVILPFVDFFQKKGAILILLFIILYKIGDAIASQMTMPFYLEMGYTKIEIANIVKVFGTGATIFGATFGGVLLLRFPLMGCLWVFGILQAVSTFGFSLVALSEVNLYLLAFVIAFENIAGGLGTAAYAAYMASMTNKKFTGTQYALLTSLMSVPRVIVASPSGYLVEAVGWFWFFVVCTIAAVPGLLLLIFLQKSKLTRT